MKTNEFEFDFSFHFIFDVGWIHIVRIECREISTAESCCFQSILKQKFNYKLEAKSGKRIKKNVVAK